MVTIRLAKASSVIGSVRDSRTQAAVPGAEVLVRLGGRFDGGVITSVITDAKGNFSLTGLAPSAYERVPKTLRYSEAAPKNAHCERALQMAGNLMDGDLEARLRLGYAELCRTDTLDQQAIWRLSAPKRDWRFR